MKVPSHSQAPSLIGSLSSPSSMEWLIRLVTATFRYLSHFTPLFHSSYINWNLTCIRKGKGTYDSSSFLLITPAEDPLDLGELSNCLTLCGGSSSLDPSSPFPQYCFCILLVSISGLIQWFTWPWHPTGFFCFSHIIFCYSDKKTFNLAGNQTVLRRTCWSLQSNIRYISTNLKNISFSTVLWRHPFCRDS